VQRIFLPGLTDRTVANLGSAVTLAVGVAGLLIASTESRTVFWFALFSWSGLGATFGPVILCSLYWKGTTRAGAVAGMLGGFLTAVLWVGFLKDSAYGLYEMVPGFIVSMLLTVSVSLMEAEWRRTKHTIAR
jgi:sodium/proline symporter